MWTCVCVCARGCARACVWRQAECVGYACGWDVYMCADSVCVCVCGRACVWAWVGARAGGVCTCACMYTCVGVCMRVHVHMCACGRVYPACLCAAVGGAEKSP